MPPVTHNRVEIDLAALRHNFLEIRAKTDSRARIMAVVKADGYGHGLVQAARAFQTAGCDCFGIGDVGEGALLRESGLAGEIIVLQGAEEFYFDEVLHYGLSPVVFDLPLVKALSSAAVKAGRRVGVHLKIDVGMGRLGILPHEVGAFVEGMRDLQGVRLTGFFSHLPLADSGLPDKTREHVEVFRKVLNEYGDCCGAGAVAHIANSAALLLFPDDHIDMVRPGITLYGAKPVNVLKKDVPLELRQAMSFKTEIIQVKEVPSGFGISYGHRYVTDRPSRIAVLPTGYDDGYLRRLANKAEVLIHGRRAPVRGMVCMNACMVDVTDIPTAKAGDEAVLMGRQGTGEIGVDEVAGWLDTINYEVFCLFGRCNRHVYVE